MAATPAISIGDLIRAASGLRVSNAAAIEQIAALLALRPGPDTPAEAAAGVAAPSLSLSIGAVPASAPLPAAATPAPTPAPPPIRLDLPPRDAHLDRLPDEHIVRRPPRDLRPLAELLPAPPDTADLAETTLFVSRWQRGILTAAISTPNADGPIDIARVVDDIANGLAVQQLPRLPVHTTRKGLQALVDIADGMRPFGDDVARLERVLRLTAGDDGVEVLRFERVPVDGAGRGTRRTWKPYAPPPAGTPVLAVSDFGLGSPVVDAAAMESGWRTVAALAAQQGCALLALTPFPPPRWPAWFVQIFSAIHWDRPTNAIAARRAAERGARRWR